MERISFEARLCINISNVKEIRIIDILINLCLATSLLKGGGLWWQEPTQEINVQAVFLAFKLCQE